MNDSKFAHTDHITYARKFLIFRKSDKQENPPKPLFIGAHNVFEVGCKLESPCGHIGESNVFECRSFVGVDVKIGSGCVIGKLILIISRNKFKLSIAKITIISL